MTLTRELEAQQSELIKSREEEILTLKEISNKLASELDTRTSEFMKMQDDYDTLKRSND